MKRLLIILFIFISLISFGQWTDSGVLLQGLSEDGSNFYGGFVTGPKKSTDGGVTWSDLGTTGLSGFALQVRGIGAFDSLLLVGSPVFGSQGGLYRSVDENNWQLVDNVLGGISNIPDKFYYQNGRIFTTISASDPGVSDDYGKSWSLLFPSAGTAFSCPRIHVEASNVYVTTNNITYDGTNSSALLKSSDNGQTWMALDPGIQSGGGVFKTSNGRLIVTESGNQRRILYSDDESNWQESSTSIQLGTNPDFREVDGVIYMATGVGGAGVFKSEDNGINWTEINEGINPTTRDNASLLAYNGSNLLVGTTAATTSVAYWTLGETSSQPEIEVEVSGASIADGGNYDFGDLEEGTSGSEVTFTISNIGTDDLILGDIDLMGTNSSDFTLEESIANTSIVSGASANFDVSFSPEMDNIGSLSATIRIVNNDSDEGEFDIQLNGNSTEAPMPPGISVSVNGSPLSNGGVIDFEEIILESTVSLEVIIENDGIGDLILTGNPTISISGANTEDFSGDISSLETTIIPGASTSFTATFSPQSLGSKAASISIENNAEGDDPFIINLAGEAVEEPLAIQDSEYPIFYPNPVQDQLRLSIPPSDIHKKWTMRISDLYGKEILHQSVDLRNELIIDVSKWEPGIYLLQLRDLQENARYQLRIRKE